MLIIQLSLVVYRMKAMSVKWQQARDHGFLKNEKRDGEQGKSLGKMCSEVASGLSGIVELGLTKECQGQIKEKARIPCQQVMTLEFLSITLKNFLRSLCMSQGDTRLVL